MKARKKAIDFRQTRPPLDRMLRIHQEVQGQTFPNSAFLSQKLEISTKTVHRDVEFMRDRLNLPIEWDGAKNGYYYTRPVTNFPTMHFTEESWWRSLSLKKPCNNIAAQVSKSRF